MFKSIWFYLIAGVVVVGGGYFIVNHYVTVNNNTVAPASQPIPTDHSAVTPPSKDEEELNRKRQEGIGSIDKLKPVEIPPAQKNNSR